MFNHAREKFRDMTKAIQKYINDFSQLRMMKIRFPNFFFFFSIVHQNKKENFMIIDLNHEGRIKSKTIEATL